MSCSYCKKDLKIKSKGLCNACYRRLQRNGTTSYKQIKEVLPCSCCKREVKATVKGLCKNCYQRLLKKGTTDYAPIKEPQFCHIKDCSTKVVANGLCDKHYRRLKRTGSTDVTDPYRGSREKHPMYHTWIWIRRYRTTDAVCDEWYDDFFQFVMDVGDRPSKSHKFYRADDSKPYGKDNFVWKESITQRVDGEDERTFQNRRARVYRHLRSEEYQDVDLKKQYGLKRGGYNELLEEQNGVCAICGNDETAVKGGTNNIRRLAVDHCHTSGEIRGLLCTSCNTMLGQAKDSKDILLKAIDYLNKFD